MRRSAARSSGRGRWTWGPAPPGAHKATCPACARTRDQLPAGFVTLSGEFFNAHRAELLHLARNTAEHECSEHPLNRIMNVVEMPAEAVITTCDVHSARRIGEALERAYRRRSQHALRQGRVLGTRQLEALACKYRCRSPSATWRIRQRSTHASARTRPSWRSSTEVSSVVTSSSRSRVDTSSRAAGSTSASPSSVPGHELIVNRDHDEDVYVALRDAFASVTRRLEDVARRQHGQVKVHESKG